MKTLNTTHKILTTTALVSLFVLFDISFAQPAIEIRYIPEASVTSTPANTNARTEEPKVNAVTEMISNARYWVDFLRNSVNSDKEEFKANESSAEVREMETTPDYWPQTLKTIVDQEESAGNNEMETDPDFWIHFLQTTVDAGNPNS